jgi:putative ABC transport system ATP-binding protein
VSTVLELNGVGRIYRRGSVEVTALHDVDLRVEAGQLVAVMGPSGSGKSTLLNLAGGLDRATSGEVTVAGDSLSVLDATSLAARRRSVVGYVFQELNLIGGLTAAENVALPLELDGRSARAARTDALEALESVGLDRVADRFPDDLSGGQQQRVAIARALVGTRRLILADEPTGALDSVAGEEIISLLRQRCEQGAAVVLVTHKPRYAAWADQVVFLRDGAVVSAPSVTGSSGAGSWVTGLSSDGSSAASDLSDSAGESGARS